MDQKWKILLYRTLQGNSPVKEFIDGLELKTQSKIYDAINLLRDFGSRLGSPHIKKLTGTELWELRILGADSIRVLYIAVTSKTFCSCMDLKRKRIKLPVGK